MELRTLETELRIWVDRWPDKLERPPKLPLYPEPHHPWCYGLEGLAQRDHYHLALLLVARRIAADDMYPGMSEGLPRMRQHLLKRRRPDLAQHVITYPLAVTRHLGCGLRSPVYEWIGPDPWGRAPLGPIWGRDPLGPTRRWTGDGAQA